MRAPPVRPVPWGARGVGAERLAGELFAAVPPAPPLSAQARERHLARLAKASLRSQAGSQRALRLVLVVSLALFGPVALAATRAGVPAAIWHWMRSEAAPSVPVRPRAPSSLAVPPVVDIEVEPTSLVVRPEAAGNADLDATPLRGTQEVPARPVVGALATTSSAPTFQPPAPGSAPQGLPSGPGAPPSEASPVALHAASPALGAPTSAPPTLEEPVDPLADSPPPMPTAEECRKEVLRLNIVLTEPATDDEAELALFSRAVCHLVLGDTTRSDADIAQYHARFPNGRFAKRLGLGPHH